MADLLTDLAKLEREGWQALSAGRGGAFYDVVLTDDAVMVLPFAVLDRTASLEAMDEAAPWSRFDITDEQLVNLSEDSKMLIYRATAQRERGPEYRALMSTTYVHTGGRWRVRVHQQTPLPREP
jgi:hypothetical protein